MKFEAGTKLVWDDWNIEHIKRHFVSVAEVEKVFKPKRFVRQSYKDRLLVINRVGKRILIVVVSFEK